MARSALCVEYVQARMVVDTNLKALMRKPLLKVLCSLGKWLILDTAIKLTHLPFSHYS
jgi:hypothetical protein